jgi:hypothetical protein
MKGLRMAGRSALHEWLNSAVAVVALLMSAVSAYFTWQSNQVKKEALAMMTRPTGACHTEYHGGEERGDIGLCWSVTLANESENRLSIVDYEVFDILDGKRVWIGGFRNLEAVDGTPLSLPITLDGGEAREIIVRSPIMVPPAVAHAIAQLPEYQGHALASLTLSAIQRALAAAKLDFMGNQVEPMIIDGQVTGWSIPPPFKSALSELVLTTGRGATFNMRMGYPPHFD